jgi:5-formyltetrahydrofolate cyclo-ligase
MPNEAFHLFNVEGTSPKAKLRQKMLAERLSFPIDEKNTADWQLVNNLRRVLMRDSEVGVIALYVAMKGEPDILGSEIIDLRNSGVVVTLPRVIEKGWPLVFNTYNPSYEFSHDALGLPCSGGPVADPRIVCVPCLAFTRKGERLGYGGGYYDRTLQSLRESKNITTIGIAYSSQEVEKLPTEEHDQMLDFIVTENEVITC